VSERRRDGVCTGTPVDMHIAASARSSVIRALGGDEMFEIDHDIGADPDRWLAIRTGRGETGYIPADAAIRATERWAADDSGGATDTGAQRDRAVRDVWVGVGFIVAGIGLLWYFSGIGSWPSSGGAREWVALGYGVFRLGRGLMNLT
jgi:hypothetical protein